ncbi:MAG: hypothetical protein H3C31_05680 [Brumimicrobium sp.]|nr:hypothetical protein [Brumimicrobium sp.]MCO5268250.1 putative porin [Brumimicrobium sp.]
MDLRKSVVLLLLLLPNLLWGQEKFFYPRVDSITIDYRSDNHWLDSIDAGFIGDINLRPAAGFEQLMEHNLAKNIFSNTGGLAYLFESKKVIPKFSGLPYVGFQYAFGTKVTQDLKVEYQQFYRPQTHLHFMYNRRTSNGLLRNSGYTLNDLSLLFYHQKKRYATNVDAYFGAYDYAENFGIATDTLLQDFAIEFTPINNETAQTKVRKLDVKWDNYFRIIGDSLIGTGLKTRHQYTLTNRKFEDQIFNDSLYDTLYIDTLATRDQYQTGRISNGAGFYFSSPYFQIDATINHSYWRNQNLGVNRDTNELFVHSNLSATFKNKFFLGNEFYFNILGAIGEIKDYVRLDYRIVKNLDFRGKVNFENVYPDPYQRFHQANYYQWEIDKLKMQQKLQVSGGIKYGDTSFVQANVLWTTITNGRYFIGNQWRQDTLDVVSVGAIQVKGAIRLKWFAFYPSITYRFGSANFAYQPVFSTMNRISFSFKLFKAKKLGMAVGTDVGYETAYQYMAYNNVLDVYAPLQNGAKAGNMLKLNAFLALSIDQFRFFVKAENLSSLWNDATTRIDVNYPITPMMIRIGITWDFFN